MGALLPDFMRVRDRDLAGLRRDVAAGVRLHRAIDQWTDSHAAFGRVRARLVDAVGLFAPVAADVVFDYALCQAWEHPSVRAAASASVVAPGVGPQRFIDEIHAALQESLRDADDDAVADPAADADVSGVSGESSGPISRSMPGAMLPPGARQVDQLLQRMIDGAWLRRYETLEGLELTFSDMNQRLQRRFGDPEQGKVLDRRGRAIDLRPALAVIRRDGTDIVNDFLDLYSELIRAAARKEAA